MELLRRHPFLAVGLITALAVWAVELGAAWLAPAARFLIIPMWLMRTLEIVMGFGALPRWLDLTIGMPLLFAPYVALDALLVRRRRGRVGLRAA